MVQLKSFVLSFLLLLLTLALQANDTVAIKTNDSLTLAQSYVNLTLTENYFDTLSIERLQKILPFEESELGSIKDSNFIHANAYLYNFSYALLYFNKAALLFRTNTKPGREALLQWKKTLETAIKYFNLVNLNYYPFEQPNTYNGFIEFSATACQNLKKNILQLKAEFNIFFNTNIYPDFQRIFYETKKTGHFNFDSLAYYTTLFNLPLSRNILNNTGHGKTVNKSDSKGLSDIDTAYNLELALDLISRYLQLNYLAINESVHAGNVTTLYVQYKYFINDININNSNVLFNIENDSKLKKDFFFLAEINPEVCHILYNVLKEKYLSALITTIEGYDSLSRIEKNFNSLNTGEIAKILSMQENKLASVNDSVHISNYRYLYLQTLSLLYYTQAKLLFVQNAKPGRAILLQCKNTLEKAVNKFNLSELDSVFPPNTDRQLFIDLINFSDAGCKKLQSDIIDLKAIFNPHFNLDIYPDFKRIFYAEKKLGQFNFDSLKYYTLMYNLPLSRGILDNEYSGRTKNDDDNTYTWAITNKYKLDIALDLISRYLQLNYIIKIKNDGKEKCEYIWTCYDFFVEDLNPADTVNFGGLDNYNKITKDGFFRKELDTATCNKLRTRLIKKCGEPVIHDTDSDGVPDELNANPNAPTGGMGIPGRYYFPIPAPFPSAYLSVKNYKPGLKTMQQVDGYFKSIFNNNGYAGHLHYYYVQSGFALTTSLEKINKDGSPVSGNARWNVSVSGNGSLSMYETFKSIFFSTESNFRIIALVVSPGAAAVQRSTSTIGTMQDLLINSYPALPADLESFSLPQKTLTVLIYNYYQSDIGKVPMLDISKHLSAKDHLEKSGLGELLNNR